MCRTPSVEPSKLTFDLPVVVTGQWESQSEERGEEPELIPELWQISPQLLSTKDRS